MNHHQNRPISRRQLYMASVMTAIFAWNGPAQALPGGPVIPGGGGSATFDSSIPNSLTVNQSSNRVVINWNAFNIANGETVKFAQPSQSSIAFNVIPASAGITRISGALNANGGVWLFSPGGFIFGSGAAVNTGSFLASTGIFKEDAASLNQAMTGNTIQISPQATPGQGAIEVDGSSSNGSMTIGGASITAGAGFVLLQAPTITQDGAVTASDAVVYNADNGVNVQFTPTTDSHGNDAGVALVNESSPAGTPSASAITQGASGSTTAGSWFEADAANDDTVPGSGIINLGGAVTANGMKTDGSSVILDADSAVNIPTGGSLTSAGAIRIDPAGPVTVDGPISSGTSVFIAATEVILGPNGAIAAGPNGPQSGTISTSSSTSSIILQNSAAAGLTPVGQGPAVGDILIGTPLTWSNPGALTLDAYHSIVVSGAITASDPNVQVSLVTDDGGSGGDYSFLNGGSLSFTGTPDFGESLYINGAQYSLIFNQADLLNINNDLGGVYALATPLDFAPINTAGNGATATIFTAAPIANLANNPFGGTFTGLGNTISNLTITANIPIAQYQFEGINYSATNGQVGLFGSVASGAMVRDVSLINAKVSGGAGMQVGALVGHLDGTVQNDSASGRVLTGDGTNSAYGYAVADAGGLVGESYGSILNSRASTTVSGGNAFAGGLVGSALGGSSIAGSSATGAVSVGATDGANAPAAGGLVGQVYGFDLGGAPQATSVTGAFATGAVSGGDGSVVGGLVGEVTGPQALVSDAYASGLVTQTAAPASGLNDVAGGFVGEVANGASIDQSYASGAVQTLAGANTAVSTLAGGFAGDIDSGATVTNSYALGAVSSSGGSVSDTGGFAGFVQRNATASDVYATGHVTGSGTTGGLVAVIGDGDPDSGPPNYAPPDTASVSNSYWDVGATGQMSGYTLIGAGTSATKVSGIGGSTGFSPYATASYANFDLTGTWFMIAGETRPILRSEYATTITNAHQLQLMTLHPNAAYTLASDIDASETTSAAGVWNPANGFAPVGALLAAPFTGSLNGAGYTVSNLTIKDTTATPQAGVAGFSSNGFVGLFGVIGAGGLVQDITLANASVTGGDGMAVGALAGLDLGGIGHATSSGLVAAGNTVTTTPPTFALAGGLVGGGALGGTITNASSSAAVSAGSAGIAGGLVGLLTDGGSISNAFAAGAVSVGTAAGGDASEAGGLVGWMYGYSSPNDVGAAAVSVIGSYATGQVSSGAGSTIGGFVGALENGVVANSYATGAVANASGVGTLYQSGGGSSNGDLAGGFAGEIDNNSTVFGSYASGAVNTVGAAAGAPITLAGGFVGEMDTGATVADAYALGAVTVAGGVAGAAGGFAGLVQGAASIDQVYATGHISGGSQSGGLVGMLGNAGDTTSPTSGVLSDSYWDEGTTGTTTGFNLSGGGAAANVAGISGATNLSPYAASSYANFDLAGVWFMIEGETRPILRSEYATTITNAHQLQLMSLDPTADYTLANDVNASETASAAGVWNPANGFVPVGVAGGGATPFSGQFDGQGYIVSNLTIIDTAPVAQTSGFGAASNGAVGLFGVISGGVSNLKLANASVTGGDGMSVGVLAGDLAAGGVVSKVSSSGTVVTGDGVSTGNGFADATAGGLVGASSGYIANSSSSASVRGGQASVGGLVGELQDGEIQTAFASGAVTVGANAGGQTPNAGGLAGSSTGGSTILDSYATGNVDAGASSAAGGFIGVSQGSITDASAAGVVTQAAGQNGVEDLAGGFAGQITGGQVAQSFSTGAVNVAGSSTPALAGGFAGQVDGGTVMNAYSTSPVTVSNSLSDSVGGFVGDIASGSVSDVYAIGAVSASGSVGGVAGSVEGDLSNAYWNSATTGQQTGANGASASDISGDPYDANSYAGFDFTNVWSAPSPGFYPQLYGVSHVLSIAADDTTSVYGQFPIYTLSATGLQGGDTFVPNVQAIQFTQSGAISSTSGYYNVGAVDLNVAGATASGPSGAYRFIAAPDGTLTVTQASLTLYASSDDKTYDGGTDDPNANIGESGLVAGDGYSASESYDGPNVGGHTLSIDGYTINDGNGGANYSVSTQDGAGQINPIDLTAILVGTVEKTYDTNTDATLTAANYQLPGVINGEDVTLINTPTSGTYDTADVGTGKTVTVNGLSSSLSGSGAGNYILEDSASGAVGIIDPAPLTLTAIGDTKTYDGTTNDALIPTESGLLGNDGYTATQSFASKDVLAAGASLLSVDPGYTISDGNGGNNYAVTLVSASGTINPAPLVLSATSDTKTYDGGTSSSAMPTANTLFGGDTLTATQSFGSKNVLGAGNSVLAIDPGYTINDGNGGADYTVTQVKTAQGTINPAPLVLNATSDTKTYDGGTSSGATPTADTLLGGDTLTAAQSFQSKDVLGAGNSVLAIDPGYTINDGNGGADYTITQVKTAQGTINPAPLALNAVTDSKPYDGGTSSSGTPTYDPSQVFGGDTVTGLTQDFVSKDVLAGGSTLQVNGYTINDGNGGADYAVTTNTASGAITPAPLTLNAVMDSKPYDGGTSSSGTPTYDPSQVLGSDSVTGLAQDFVSKDVLGARLSTLQVSGYTINDGNGGADYIVTTTTARGTITPAPLVLNATPDTKTYDGGTSSSAAPAADTLLGGDTLAATQSFASKNVLGAGNSVLAIDPGYTINDGNGGADYTITKVNTAQGTINPLALTAALTGTVEKTYDTTTAASLDGANYTLPGVIQGDNVSLNDPASGTYDNANAGTGKLVSVTGLQISGADAANYTVNGAAAGDVGTIAQAPLTVSAVSDTKTYDGGVLSSATPTGSGLLGGDTVSGLTESFDSKNAGARTLSVTGYTISDGNDGGNYAVITTTAAGAIDPKALTASLTGTVDKTYDGNTAATLAADNYSLTGVISGDTLKLNDPTSGTYDDASAGTGKLVSVSGLALSGADAANYTVNGSAAGPVGTITTPPQTLQITVPVNDVTSSGFAAATAATAAIAAVDSANATVINVFPVAPTDDQAAKGDNLPITGAGNRDLWTGSDESGQLCPPTAPCPVTPGAKP